MIRRLPTVKLKHRANGEELNVNLSDYTVNIAAWADWKIVGQTHGNVEDDAVEAAIREAEANARRAERHGDAERIQKANAVTDAVSAGPGGKKRGRPAKASSEIVAEAKADEGFE